MTKRFTAASVGTLAGLVLIACVGDDPAASSSPPGSADASSQTTNDAGGTPSDDGAVGATDAGDGGCAEGLTACSSKCVVLDSDALHCGRCGHDCGGGTCSKGVCAPVQLVASFDGNTKNLAAADDTYFLTKGGEVYACKDVDCAKRTTIASFTDYPLNDGLAAGGSRVMFAASPNNAVSQYQGLFSCRDTGCVTLPGDVLVTAGKYVAIDAVATGGTANGQVAWGTNNNGNRSIGTSKCSSVSCSSSVVFSGLTPAPETTFVAVDDTNVYFTQIVSTTRNLVMCPVGGCGGSTATVIGNLGNTSSSALVALRTYNGTIYGAIQASNPRVDSCTATAGGGCSPVITGIASFTAFDLDESGIYYGADYQGTLETCKLTGCGAGPTKLVPSVATNAPTYLNLRVSGRYVYWIQDVGGTKSVWRLAKP